jgi:hypothetical protein
MFAAPFDEPRDERRWVEGPARKTPGLKKKLDI